MKRFIAVMVADTVIGGFVGAELMDSSFSITGAVGGGVGTDTIQLRLGAFFDAQERKRKEKLLPPEMRAVFDRMLDKNTSSRQQHPKPTPRQQTQRTAPPEKKDSGNPQELYLSTTSGLISVQLMPKYS